MQEQEACRQPSAAEEPIFRGHKEPAAAQDAGGGAEQEALQDGGRGGEHRVSDAARWLAVVVRPAEEIVGRRLTVFGGGIEEHFLVCFCEVHISC